MGRATTGYVKLPPLVRQWPPEWRERYEERAGIKEFEGNLPREIAEQQAEREVRMEHKVVAGVADA